ncbi:MAG: ATP-binding region ATPase domain protein [Gemmatimonadetes bacterium]|nr:ATP-binding region ATPase domain protein [Gemmatimonadota bacterium]
MHLADRPVTFRGGIWISLTPVVAAVIALAVLAAVPWTTNWRLTRVRLDIAESLAPARQLVQDITAALALELAARNQAARDGTHGTAGYDAAAVVERERDSALGALGPRLGGNLAVDIARFRALIAQWHAQDGSMSATGTPVALTDVVAAANHLDSALVSRRAQQMRRIRSLENVDVLVPSVFVPILVVVLLAVFWTGRRMAALARDAERSRLALAFAAEQRVTLLRGLTHDLKNSLGAASGFATLLRDETSGPLTPLQRDQVTRITRIIDETITSVEDALTVARTEAGTLPVRRHQEDLRALALESASDYLAAAERAGLTLTVEFSEELPPVETDSSLVSKIIGNLLSNAIKYTPRGGRVWLRASAPPAWDQLNEAGPWAVVEVCDTGPGIPGALREKVFDEFFRAPSATIAAGGEGIGLAMSRRVARLLGGDVTLESEEGWGATFALWLPVPSEGGASLTPPPKVLPHRRAADMFNGAALPATVPRSPPMQ